jgi:uncharacterized protein
MNTNKIPNWFKPKMIIGCIHVRPLPGSPSYKGNMNKVIEKAVTEAKLLTQLGVDGLIIENMHDTPYIKGKADAETVAGMSVVSFAVRNVVEVPLGIQILSGAGIESVGVAIASGLQFIRIEGFAFAHVADEGIIDSCAARMLRKMAELKGQDISIWADIKKKHSSHAITADVSIGEMAEACEFMRADGIVITGRSTGKETNIDDLNAVKKDTELPVIIGSGLTAENFHIYKDKADAFIVGSYFKKDGHWENEIDETRVEKLLEVLK